MHITLACTNKNTLECNNTFLADKYIFVYCLRTFSDVEVEEVTVESSLYTACHDGYQIIKPLTIVTEYPVDNVQGTVGAKGKEVVGSDSLRLSCLRDHIELGHDGH